MTKFERIVLAIQLILLLGGAYICKAQEPKLHILERSTAIDLYNKLDKGTITFTNPDGRVVAVWIKDETDASFRDALQLALGEVKEQSSIKGSGCLQIHRGEECTGDARIKVGER